MFIYDYTFISDNTIRCNIAGGYAYITSEYQIILFKQWIKESKKMQFTSQETIDYLNYCLEMTND